MMKRKQPGIVVTLTITTIVFIVLPLPFAVFSGGIDWITTGARIPNEFLVTYLIGLLIFPIGIGWLMVRNLIHEHRRQVQSRKPIDYLA